VPDAAGFRPALPAGITMPDATISGQKFTTPPWSGYHDAHFQNEYVEAGFEQIFDNPAWP
jgi:hypothetical protein